jgi:hypothetical protein
MRNRSDGFTDRCRVVPLASRLPVGPLGTELGGTGLGEHELLRDNHDGQRP